MIANTVTVSRIVFSLLLLVFPASSRVFSLLYLLCGVSDVLDGFLARRLRTESSEGELLDSIADLFFAVAYAVKILPLLRLPAWILAWIVLIAIAKTVGIIKRSKRGQKVCIEHSTANKLTGLLVFLLPLTVSLPDIQYFAAAVCAIATLAAVKELFVTAEY